MARLRVICLPLIIGSALVAESNLDPGATNAIYAANAGWIEARTSPEQGLVIREDYISGHAYGANIGWIDFGDGMPLNGYAYSNVAEGDHGVNVSEKGFLSGFAYGANIGWINFEWAGEFAFELDPSLPRIDLKTGQLAGYAYSANLGWIDLTGLAIERFLLVDDDNDTIGDGWEMLYFGSINVANETSDFDGDGGSDLAEYEAFTSPIDASATVPKIQLGIDPFDGAFLGIEVLAARTARSYQLYESTDLIEWTPVGGAQSPFLDFETLTLTPDRFIGVDSRIFYQVDVIKPLR